MNGCAWIERRPTASDADCDDRNKFRHPGADFGLPLAPGGALPARRDFAYDLNCDGKQEIGSTRYTGEISSNGTLEVLDESVCSATCSCQIAVMRETTCGQPYAMATCNGNLTFYFACR